MPRRCSGCVQWEQRYDRLQAAFIAVQAPAATAPPIEVPQPDVPPAVVLDAMRRISPIKDRAFDANWAYWERNKEHAAAHPDAFAEEILEGVQYERVPVIPQADIAAEEND